MIGWRFEEALAVHTREAVMRWWAHRCPSPPAPIPEGLVEDLQTARLALDNGLQSRLWDLATVSEEPPRAALTERIAELDPWHIVSTMAVAPAERHTGEDHDLITALRERARRRERLSRPRFPSKSRRRLRDLAAGRGGLTAVLEDDDACRMLRFGAMLCDLVELDGEESELDPDGIRALLAQLTAAEARWAAEAVLNDPLVGTDDRGRPADREITEFVRAVIEAIYRRIGYRITSNITRKAARSPNWDDLPGLDIQLILDLLACHAPSKTPEAVANLIKGA